MAARSKYYRLAGHATVPCEMWEWALAFKQDRRVAFTDITNDVHVSTVFLGLDHSYSDEGPPLLFETMVFGGEFDQHMQRHSTWEQAEAGHSEVVATVRRAMFKVLN